MNSTLMQSSIGLIVIVNKKWDRKNCRCYTIQRQSDKAYLSSHNDRKHIWWNKSKCPSDWEYFYPVKIQNEEYVFKTHHNTFFLIDKVTKKKISALIFL